MTFLSGLRLLTASESVGVSGFLLFSHLASKRANLDTTASTLHKISTFILPIMAGMTLSFVTHSVLPVWIFTSLTAIVALGPFDRAFSEKLTFFAWTVHLVASAALLFLQPSLYHLACLGMNSSPIWLAPSTPSISTMVNRTPPGPVAGPEDWSAD